MFKWILQIRLAYTKYILEMVTDDMIGTQLLNGASHKLLMQNPYYRKMNRKAELQRQRITKLYQLLENEHV